MVAVLLLSRKKYPSLTTKKSPPYNKKNIPHRHNKNPAPHIWLCTACPTESPRGRAAQKNINKQSFAAITRQGIAESFALRGKFRDKFPGGRVKLC